jgi:hypothetical protein
MAQRFSLNPSLSVLFHSFRSFEGLHFETLNLTIRMEKQKSEQEKHFDFVKAG